MDEKELAFVNEAAATPRPLKVVPTFASVAAWGAGPGEMNLNRVLVVDGERDITFHKPLATAAHITADSTVLNVFDKGQGQGRGDPASDRAEGCQWREAGDAGGVALCAWATVASADRRTASLSRIRCRRAVRTRSSTFRPGRIRRWSIVCAAIAIRCTPIRNSPSEQASRGRSCTACAPTASPAAACSRPMPNYDPDRVQAARGAVLLAGLSRRDRHARALEGRQCDFIRGQGEGAGRHGDQERQDGAGVEASFVIPGRASARTRNLELMISFRKLEIPGSLRPPE